MKKEIKFSKQAESYKDIISFIFALILSQLIWKVMFYDDFDNCRWDSKYLNITHIIDNYCFFIANIAEKYLKYFNIEYVQNGNMFYFDNNTSLGIVWGCTGIKQTIVFIISILLSRGSIIYKIPYIISGSILVFCINIFRILMLLLTTLHRVDLFYIMHEYFFKILFYVFIFFLWAIWIEIILPKFLKNNKVNAEKNDKK